MATPWKLIFISYKNAMENKFLKISTWPFSKGLLDKLFFEFRSERVFVYLFIPGELLCLFEADI